MANRPLLIKLSSGGAYVNLANIVSMSIVREQEHRVLKEEFVNSNEDRKPTDEDYTVDTFDTVCFYFLGRDELVLRAGHEITNEEFDRVSTIIDELEYLPRHERS